MHALRLSALCLWLATAAAVAGPSQPDEAIRQTTEQVQAAIREHHDEYLRDQAKFYAMVDQLVVPRFDSRGIGQMVLGRNWRNASPEQRERFIDAFKNSLVHSYADALLRYADTVKAEWKPVHVAADAPEARVNADILRGQGPPIPISFSLRRVDGDWKVYDVVVDGISLGTTFRAQFNAEIKKNGLDGLIARLEGGGKPLPDNALDSAKPQG